jgi:hypothetical protein
MWQRSWLAKASYGGVMKVINGGVSEILNGWRIQKRNENQWLA